MNILLIVPRFRDSYGEYYEFPLGLACISAMLKKHGYSVTCLNLNHFENNRDEEVIKKAIVDNNIKIVATGGLSAHYHKINHIFSIVKNLNKSLITILGGGIISSEPQLIYEALDIDYGVLNEGELTIIELVDAIIQQKDKSQIKGIVYALHGETKITPPRDSIEALDTLPFPDYDSFDVAHYLDMQLPNDNYYMYPFDKPRALPVITTRSCPYSCTFCYHPLGKKYRVSSLDYFFENLDILVAKYDINILLILDELFSVNKTRMLEFASKIKKYNLKWIAQMRVDDVDEETLIKLKESGLYYISYGLESASDEVLKSMKKKIKISKIEQALFLTKKHHIGIQGNFIFGDSAETKETYTETINWWEKHKEYQINLGVIEAYPGTPIYLEAIKRGLIKEQLEFIKKGCPPLNMTKMNDTKYQEMVQKIWQKSYECKIYAKLIKSKKIDYNEIKGNIYEFDIQCPHCQSEVRYTNMHKEESGSFKLGCKICHQRFDLRLEEVFANDYEDVAQHYKKINETISLHARIALIPCIPEFKLVSILNSSFTDNWKKINFEYFLDSNASKEGEKYLNGHITNYKKENFFDTIDKDIVYLIAPLRSKSIAENIKNQLLQYGVQEEKILVMPNG